MPHRPVRFPPGQVAGACPCRPLRALRLRRAIKSSSQPPELAWSPLLVPRVGSRGDVLGPARPLLRARALPAAWQEVFAVPFMAEIKTPDSLGGGGWPILPKILMILLPVVKQTRWNWTLEHELSVHPTGASVGGHPPAPRSGAVAFLVASRRSFLYFYHFQVESLLVGHLRV